MEETLEQVLADECEEAQVLRKRGYAHDAELTERLLDRVAKACREYLLWLSEDNARLWSGMSLAWLRSEFPKLEAMGYAEWRNGRRWFRACALPRRGDLEAAREAGRQAGLAAAQLAVQPGRQSA